MNVYFSMEKKGDVNMYVSDPLLKPRLKYYVGKIDPGTWDKKKKKVSGPYGNGFNSKMKILESHAVLAFDKLLKSDSLCTDNLYNEICILDERPDKVKMVNSDMIKWFERWIYLAKVGENGVRRKTKGGKEYSPGTIKTLESLKSCLENFEKDTGYKLEWKNINDAFYEKFINYCWDVLKNHDLSVGCKVSYLKQFIDWCVDEKILSRVLYSKKWIVFSEPDADGIALMPEEIKFLYKMPIRQGDQINGCWVSADRAFFLDKVRKKYLVGCLTLLRPGDVAQLSEGDLIIQGDVWQLNPIQDKTDKPILIKLHHIAVEIIKEYRHQYTTLLPPMRAAEFIDALKDLAQLFRAYINTQDLSGKITNNWNNPFTRTMYKRGKAERTQIDFCDMFRPHTQRATGATTLLILGMREFEVKALGGWSPRSRSFGKYVRLAQNYIDAQSASTWDKLEFDLKVS
jgi:integrase